MCVYSHKCLVNPKNLCFSYLNKSAKVNSQIYKNKKKDSWILWGSQKFENPNPISFWVDISKRAFAL